MDAQTFLQTLGPRELIRYGLLILVGIAVLVGLFQCFYMVGADSEAVVLRFGKHIETTAPGLHFKFPFGIDEAHVIPVEYVRTMEFGFYTAVPGKRTQYGPTTEAQKGAARMLSGDLNIASVNWTVQYRIKDIKDYLFNVEDVPGTIRDVGESVMRALVGDRSVDEVLTIGRTELHREALRVTQDELDEIGCGVELTKLNLQDVRPPDPVKEAFDGVNQARQKKEELINQAMSERNRNVPAARGERERTIDEADAYKDRKVREVTGEMNAFLNRYAAYQKAKEETRVRLYMETMEDILQKSERKIFVDASVRSILPFLDLGASKGGER
ncbi:MAG: FtsH protease activity modulator HflK [Phycisphaerae bacterium]